MMRVGSGLYKQQINEFPSFPLIPAVFCNNLWHLGAKLVKLNKIALGQFNISDSDSSMITRGSWQKQIVSNSNLSLN